MHPLQGQGRQRGGGGGRDGGGSRGEGVRGRHGGCLFDLFSFSSPRCLSSLSTAIPTARVDAAEKAPVYIGDVSSKRLGEQGVDVRKKGYGRINYIAMIHDVQNNIYTYPPFPKSFHFCTPPLFFVYSRKAQHRAINIHIYIYMMIKYGVSVWT